MCKEKVSLIRSLLCKKRKPIEKKVKNELLCVIVSVWRVSLCVQLCKKQNYVHSATNMTCDCRNPFVLS